MIFRCRHIGFILLLAVTTVFGQQPAAADTAKAAETKKSKSDLDTTITYSAKYIENLVEDRISCFYGSAVVHYRQMTLKAGKICIDWNTNLLTAEGRPDTSWTKKPGQKDSVQVIGVREQPVLIEGDSQMTGEMMVYNYKTEKGRVLRGRTQLEEGHYLGRQIKMVGEKTINVSHSEFTTCDLDTAPPHFHFESRRLKMIVNQRVIAKPVVMYIGHIPVLALPFAFFPTQKGRHSGILIPRYGESTNEGRFLRDMGYYWAPNDYFDARATIDFFEKTGWLMDAGVNYAVRYLLNGGIDGSLTRKNFASGYQARRWDLNIRHNQEIDPTSRFSANGFFVSDNSFYRDLSTNLSTRLTRELRSNATYSKTWPEAKWSLSVNVSQVHDLEEDLTQTSLPQLSLRKNQTQLFKPQKSKKPGAAGPGARPARREDRWYHYFYVSYSSNLNNTRRESWLRTAADTVKKVDTNLQMSHNLDFSLNSPKKYFGFLSVNHFVDFQEDWFDRSHAYGLDAATNQITDNTEHGFAARHTFSYSASANTKLYGLFTPKIGDLQAIRHVMTPSISFSYRPDFSDKIWGYYQEVADTSGQIIRKDRFGGSTYSGGSKAVNLSVRNLFQMKRGVGEKVKKFDLFTMDLSTGYNFEAKQYRLSDLRTTWQANPARIFSLSAGTSHTFYDWDPQKRMRVNRFLWDDGGWKQGDFLRMTSLNLNFSLRLEGKGETKGKGPATETAGVAIDSLAMEGIAPSGGPVLEDVLVRKGSRFGDDTVFEGLAIPWRLNLTFNFNLDKSIDPKNPVKRYYLDISGAELRLTPAWRIGYSGHFDLEKGQIAYHRFTFYRDLHCWEAQVDWVPSGAGKRVYFRINVKSPMLRDLKLEKHGGQGSVLGY